MRVLNAKESSKAWFATIFLVVEFDRGDLSFNIPGVGNVCKCLQTQMCTKSRCSYLFLVRVCCRFQRSRDDRCTVGKSDIKSEVENRSKLGISQSGGEKCQKYQHHQNLDGV